MTAGHEQAGGEHRFRSLALRDVEKRTHSYRAVCSCGAWASPWGPWTTICQAHTTHAHQSAGLTTVTTNRTIPTIAPVRSNRNPHPARSHA